jgi:hypothetical protein
MQSKAERTAQIVANAIKKPFDNMSKDYTFTAGVATARSSYSAAQASQYSTFTPPVETSDGGSNGPQYAVINIGGHEAKGVIQYVTREQKREEARDKKFK